MHTARKVGPGSLQNYVLEQFGAQPVKWIQEACRRLFWSISVWSPQSERNCFGALWWPARKVGPRSFQNCVLEHFGAQPAKWIQEASRRPVWIISGPRPKSWPKKSPRALCCCTGSMFCCTGAIFCRTGALFCCTGIIFRHIHLTWNGFVGRCGVLACGV